MKRIFNKAKQYPAFIQMFKFGLIGISNTVIDFSVYLVLTRFFIFWRENYLYANIIAMLIAATWSFVWNKYWTFKNSSRNASLQYIKFIAINIAGLALNTFILYIFVEFFNLPDLWGKAIGVIVVFFWGFFINKYWTFGHKE